MMSLYNQLTKPQKDQIQAEVDKYPSTGKLIMYSLERNTFVATLTIREATEVHSIFYPYEPFNLSNLYSLFA